MGSSNTVSNTGCNTCGETTVVEAKKLSGCTPAQFQRITIAAFDEAIRTSCAPVGYPFWVENPNTPDDECTGLWVMNGIDATFLGGPNGSVEVQDAYGVVLGQLNKQGATA